LGVGIWYSGYHITIRFSFITTKKQNTHTIFLCFYFIYQKKKKSVEQGS
jgi:hypothetical protein